MAAQAHEAQAQAVGGGAGTSEGAGLHLQPCASPRSAMHQLPGPQIPQTRLRKACAAMPTHRDLAGLQFQPDGIKSYQSRQSTGLDVILPQVAPGAGQGCSSRGRTRTRTRTRMAIPLARQLWSVQRIIIRMVNVK